jgi:hypothetical protein
VFAPAVLVFGAVAEAAPPMMADPCVFGYPEDPTVNADGSPAASLPCPVDPADVLGVWDFGGE